MFNVADLMRDQDADWAYLAGQDSFKLSWRNYGPMEAVIPHDELVSALNAANEQDAAEWAENLRLEILGPLADEPPAAEWMRKFDPPLEAGEGLGQILAEEQFMEQGMALFSGDSGMVKKRRTLIRLAKPAFYAEAGAEVWASGSARAWI